MKSLEAFGLCLTADSIAKRSETLLSECNAEMDRVLSSTDRSFDSTFLPFHRTEAKVSSWSCQVVLASMVHTNKEVRDAATIWKGRLKEWFDGRYANLQIYTVLDEAASRLPSNVDEETRRITKSTLGIFKNNGVDLESGKLQKLLKLKSRIAELENEYQKNLGEDVSFGKYSMQELEGCAQSFIDSLEHDSATDKYIVTVKPPHVRAIMESCRVESTRKSHYILAAARCKDRNSEILVELARFRSQAAHLLGYQSWADYKLKPTMAQKCENVWKMNETLVDKLVTVARENIGKLAELKQKDSQLEFGLWDYSYYEKVYMDKVCGIDKNLLRKYFPLEFSIHRVMTIYEYLFGIRFEQIHDTKDIVWHRDVMVFAVKNQDSGELLGCLYLDLFSRPGKYAHQCVIPLAPCFDLKPDSKSFPVVANISNLSAKSDGQEFSQLAHGEVVTFFHEFGHAVHAIVTRCKYPLQSWSWNAVPYAAGVEIDFLEVPSKGFEFFAWQTDVLEIVTLNSEQFTLKQLPDLLKKNANPKSPIERSPNPLPNEIIESLKKSQYLFAGFAYMRMVFMTTFDMIIHGISVDGEFFPSKYTKSTCPPSIKDAGWKFEDLNADKMLFLWKELQSHLTGMKLVEGTNPLANWYHMAMGYDAGYYGYLWSEAVAADIFWSLFNPKDNAGSCLNSENGKKLRSTVLSKGAVIPAKEQVHNLLGRDADAGALLKCILSGLAV